MLGRRVIAIAAVSRYCAWSSLAALLELDEKKLILPENARIVASTFAHETLNGNLPPKAIPMKIGKHENIAVKEHEKIDQVFLTNQTSLYANNELSNNHLEKIFKKIYILTLENMPFLKSIMNKQLMILVKL
jgi:hypothetical protein